jgi:hypothetical protein
MSIPAMRWVGLGILHPKALRADMGRVREAGIDVSLSIKTPGTIRPHRIFHKKASGRTRLQPV